MSREYQCVRCLKAPVNPEDAMSWSGAASPPVGIATNPCLCRECASEMGCQLAAFLGRGSFSSDNTGMILDWDWVDEILNHIKIDWTRLFMVYEKPEIEVYETSKCRYK